MSSEHPPAPGRGWKSLTQKDHRILDRILANEADMAYRRRARILLDYLEIEDDDRVIDLGCGMVSRMCSMAKTSSSSICFKAN